MSDWNTLHLFDSKIFYKKIIPELREGGPIIANYLKSKLYKNTTRIDNIDVVAIQKVKDFIKDLDVDLRYHSELSESESRIYSKHQEDEDYWKMRRLVIEEFQSKYSSEIYYFSSVLPLIMFSECAQFNPHLALGEKGFSSAILIKPGSIAQECCTAFLQLRMDTVYYNDVGHVINWLTYDEVKMLWLDINNIKPKMEHAKQFYDAFVKFIKIAIENELGFLTVSNVNEKVINLIENPI